MKKYSKQKQLEETNTKKDIKKIKFDLNQSCLQCFISKKKLIPNKKLEVNFTKLEQDLNLKNVPEKDNKLINIRPKSSSFISKNYNSFNNQLLLMQYGKHQVYVDSTKIQGNIRSDSSSPKHQSQNSQQNQIVSSCIKVITEETDNTSNPISARYMSKNQTNHQCPYYISNYYQNYPQTSVQHNRRINNSQQSRVFTIDINKIEQDGRSTIMIRNIPNKYTEQMLLQLFSKDQKAKKFDFFYLPIDYKNNCNVGYAFLNFLHPKFIKDFYYQFHGKKWQHFNSQKICHVCYARIQGTVQLSYYFEPPKVVQRDKKGRLIGINEFDYAQLQYLVSNQRNQI